MAPKPWSMKTPGQGAFQQKLDSWLWSSVNWDPKMTWMTWPRRGLNFAGRNKGLRPTFAAYALCVALAGVYFTEAASLNRFVPLYGRLHQKQYEKPRTIWDKEKVSQDGYLH